MKRKMKSKIGKVIKELCVFGVVIAIGTNIVGCGDDTKKESKKTTKLLQTEVTDETKTIPPSENEETTIGIEITTSSENEETTTEEETTKPVETTKPEYTVTKLDKTMYAKSTVNVRKGPSTDFEKVSSLSTGKQVKVVGQSDQTGWYLIQFDGKEGYVSNSYLQDKPVETTTPKPTTTKAPSTSSGKTETTTTQPQTTANPNAYKADKYIIAKNPDGSYDVKNCILGVNSGVPREQRELDAADIIERELIRLGLYEIPEGYYLTIGIRGWSDPYRIVYYDVRDWELGVRTDDKTKSVWYWYFDENFILQKEIIR